MKYFLDSNICIYLLKQHPLSVFNHFLQHTVSDIAVSSIVVAELQYGISKSRYAERNQHTLDVFLDPLTVVTFDQDAARHYGEIRADLESRGVMIGREDALIAGHARSLDVTLVTNNEREFSRVSGLDVENWAAM